MDNDKINEICDNLINKYSLETERAKAKFLGYKEGVEDFRREIMGEIIKQKSLNSKQCDGGGKNGRD